jgi:fructosamine-3-kinase
MTMPGLPERIGEVLGVLVTGIRPAGSQHGYRHVTGTLADGRSFFAKAAAAGTAPRAGPAAAPGTAPVAGAAAGPEPAAAAFAAEANGLRWLAAADDGPPVPQVLGQAADLLVIELLAPLDRASPQAARELGAGLARMHAAGAPSFGAPWPGYIASLPLDNTPLAAAAGTDWGSWYAQRRLVPYLRRASDDGALGRAGVRLLDTVISRIGELAGPPEPPSRIHGDLWSGNVLWSQGRGWLIDPAAHGGHRETDLAMLALFGAAQLGVILAGYTETRPLADGWQSRVPLHQLHPLLVHVCLFGGGYAAQLVTAAQAVLAG